MTTIINGSSPSITFSDSTTQTTAFNGQALSASPYTTALGASTLVNNTGTSNTAVGNGALAANTTASNNTAVGYQAGYSNTTSTGQVFIGYQAGYGNTTGGVSVYIGNQAGYTNTTGENQIAIGNQALKLNTTGTQNTAIGSVALYTNTTGNYNVAVGMYSLNANTTASNNTAVGYQAGYSNTTATSNTAVGYQAGYSVTTNGYNTFLGIQAGKLSTGIANTYIGAFATANGGGSTGSGNSTLGYQAGLYLTTGSRNTFVGGSDNTTNYGAGYFVTTGSNNTILGCYSGNQGGLDIRTTSNYIVLSDGDGNPRAWWRDDGLFFCKQVYTQTVGASANVFVDSTGYFARSTSALKYKQDIRDLESIDINKFRPVRYKSKCSMDDQTKDHIGFIADEVDAAGVKELVQYGAGGEVEGFSYDRMTAVLVKAIQELKAEFDAYKATHP
jgi:hypothetical protein